MDEKQLKQILHQIAAEAVPAETDLWPGLQARLNARKRPFPGGQLLPRLAGAGLTLAVVAFFLFWLMSLPQMAGVTEPIPAAPPLDNDVLVAAPLSYPDAPAALPRYRVHLTPNPDTAAAALAWAQEFGLPDAKLFRDPRSPEALLAVGSDGGRLSFYDTNIGLMSIGYLRTDWIETPEGTTISLEAGTTAATDFLAAHHLLPSSYQVRELLSRMFMADGHPSRILLVSPDLDGYALYGTENAAVGATLLLDPAGDVFSAGFLAADFSAAGSAAIRPAQAVVTDFVNGRLAPIHIEEMLPTFGGYSDVTRYHPPLPEHAIGDSVTVLETDDTHFLVAEDGSEIRATLRTGAGAKYELFTPDLAEIVDRIEYNELQVTGAIVAQTAPDTWQLEVTSWDILPQQAFTFSGCAVGPVEIDDDGAAWIVAEEVVGRVARNGRYRIPNLPTAIPNGDRIEVCTEPMLEPAEVLAWQIIFVPPRRLDVYENNDQSETDALTTETTEEGNALVIEAAELAYYFDPAGSSDTAVPVWVVRGHSQDEQSRFVAYLPAIE